MEQLRITGSQRTHDEQGGASVRKRFPTPFFTAMYTLTNYRRPTNIERKSDPYVTSEESP
jgi:hypothetical protein